MPVSNGILAKSQQIHTNIVREKPFSVSIVDRFRAMLNQKEERIRIFDSPLSTDEMLPIFEIFLSSLTLNSKIIITDLTIIAGEQRVHSQGIADAICARIIEVPVDQKLPSLYLLDSIVKNIGKDYIRHFSARLPEVFCDTYVQVDPNMRRAMRHLFGTWGTVFPPSVLHEIETQLQFSPSLNAQSSSHNSLRASQSALPSNGMHINPKYMDAKRHYGNANTIVTESASSRGRAALKTSNLDLKKSLPAADMVQKYASSFRTGRGSPSSSHEEYIVDSSPRRLVRDSPSHGPTDYKPSRVVDIEDTDEWQARNRDLKTSNVDLRGPRALISAYGMDEREKILKRKNQQSDSNSANKKIRMTWQNTEEEEFDWEESRKRGSENCSSIQHPGNLTSRQGLTINYAAPLASDYEGDDRSKALSFITDPSIVDKLSHANAVRASVNSTVGVLPNVAGAGDFTRESLIIPSHQLSHFSTKEPLSANRSFLTTVDNKLFHHEQHLESSRSNLLHIPINRLPGTVPLPLQNPAQASQMHPNPLMPNEIRTNVMLPSIPPVQSHQMITPRPYGFGTTSSSLVPPVRPSWQNINTQKMSFNNIHGPVHSFPSLIRGPNPGPTPQLKIAHTSTLVNPQSTGALSSLFSSLVAQGLISLNKQDSIGLEFDPESLKVRHESAVTALYTDLPRQCTTCGLRFKFQEEHSKHMDWHVTKNRNLRNSKTKPSPKWFVSVNMWLSGAEAVGVESTPGFMPVENNIENKEEDEMAVIANEDQNTCALCGEPFDDFFCDEMEAWMYKGAVYMDAPAGSAAGIDSSHLGPIVHVKCRSDSHGVKSI